MKNITIERSIWIDAPRERVWQAITALDQIVQWLVPNLPGAEMKRDDSGKVTIHLGPMIADIFTLARISPGARIRAV
jgi:carbon monoxide dehydrogenase subunit G